jgi:hypothetical protein
MGVFWRLGRWLSSRYTKVRVRSGDFILNVDEKQVAKDDQLLKIVQMPALFMTLHVVLSRISSL